MTAHPQVRPGGRSDRIHRAVLDAADQLVERGEVASVASLAELSGVSQMTIYRRWENAQNAILEAAFRDVMRRRSLTPTGDLRHDLTEFAANFEGNLTNPRGRRLLSTVLSALSSEDPEASASIGTYMSRRLGQLQELIDAAEPPTALTAEDVYDTVIAPLYLRQLFAYRGRYTSGELVARLLDGERPA